MVQKYILRHLNSSTLCVILFWNEVRVEFDLSFQEVVVRKCLPINQMTRFLNVAVASKQDVSIPKAWRVYFGIRNGGQCYLDYYESFIEWEGIERYHLSIPKIWILVHMRCRMIEKVLVHKTAFPFSKKSLNQLRNVIDCLTSSHTTYYFTMNISQSTKR